MTEAYRVHVRISHERPTGEVIVTDDGSLPFIDHINDPETRITDESVAADLAREALGRALSVKKAHRRPGGVIFDLTVDPRPTVPREGYRWGTEVTEQVDEA